MNICGFGSSTIIYQTHKCHKTSHYPYLIATSTTMKFRKRFSSLLWKKHDKMEHDDVWLRQYTMCTNSLKWDIPLNVLYPNIKSLIWWFHYINIITPTYLATLCLKRHDIKILVDDITWNGFLGITIFIFLHLP